MGDTPLGYLIGSVIGMLVTAALELAFQPIGRYLQHRRLTIPFRKRSAASRPDDFADSVYSWTENGQESELPGFEALYARFHSFLRPKRLVLVTGSFGTGKSYLCRHLASRLASEPDLVPIYIDASKIGSEALPSALLPPISNDEFRDLSLSELEILLNNRQAVFFLDGLDQLPYTGQSTSILDQILAFALSHQKERHAVLVLVVRKEFYDVSPELLEFCAEGKVPILQVRGLDSQDHIRRFVLSGDPAGGDTRWPVVKALMQKDSAAYDLFKIPLILKLSLKLEVELLRNAVSTGITFARIYRDAFKKMNPAEFLFLQRLAYEIYKSDRQHFILSRSILASLDLDSETFRNRVAKLGVVRQQGSYFQFEHSSLRDYFAAEWILSAIEDGGGSEILDDRVVHYLVSEFCAGLMTRDLLLHISVLLKSSDNDLVKNNLVDIVSEIEDEDLKIYGSKLISEKIEGLVFGDEMGEHALFLASIAGIFRQREPVEQVVAYAKKVGADRFRDKFFITKEGFRYYDNSQDRCILEWLRALRSGKYGYIRLLLCHLLGEWKVEKAIPVLTALADDKNEEDVIRQAAWEALQKLM